MIDSIREWIIAASILVGTFVALIVAYKNIKKPKTQASPQTQKPSKHLDVETPEGLFNLAKIVLVAVLCLCVVVVTTGFSQNQKVISRTVKEIHGNVKKNDNHLHKCMQDETEKIIDKLDSLLRTEEPNNVK